MKVSIIASRVLAGLSIAAAFAGIAVANTGSANTGSIQQPTPVSINDSTTFKKDFKQNGGNWNFNNQNANLTLSFDATQIKWEDPTKETPLNHIGITSNTLQVDTTLGGHYMERAENPLENTYSFNINAKNGVTLNDATNVFHNSNITGNTTFGTNSSLYLGGGNLNINGNATLNNVAGSGMGMGSPISIESGRLNVTGDLSMTGNTNVSFGSLDRSWNNNNQGIYVGKTATISNNTFNIQSSNLPLGELNLITAGTIANANDFGTGGTMGGNKVGSINFTKDLSTMLTNQSLLNPYLENGIGNYDLANIDAKTTYANYISYNLGLSGDKKTIFIKGEMTQAFKDIFNEKQTFASLQTFANELVTAEQGYITQANDALTQAQNSVNSAITGLESQKTSLDSEKTRLESNKAALDKQLAEATDEAQKTELQKQIDALNTQISGIQESIAQNTNDLNSAKSELKAIQAAIKDLEARNTEFAKLQTEISNLVDGTNDAEKAQKLNELKNLMLEALAPSINAGDYSLANSVLEAVKTRSDYTLLGGIMLNGMNEKLTPIVSATKNSGNTSESLKILSSIAGSSLHTQQVMQVITNQRFFKDTRDSARSATNFTDASSSMMTAINVSNDMAISSRIARANNPYQSLSKEKFAASGTTGTDGAYSYYETYNAAVWANAFGGANIIDGESGGLYGISIGVDGNVTDNVLLGIYATYANAELQDTLLSQESDNFQIGVYSQIKIAPTWELNLRAYGQLGQTDQRVSNIAGINTSDFDKKFFGVSANVGKVFDMDNGFFLKPFGGVNYYYSHTPSYTERGTILAQSVESNTNNSVSLELGLEARKYFSSSSYLFVTPKIEQYIINNGDDYVGRFVGSSTSFSIAGEDKKKTYGQLVIGGNLEITDALSLNAGIGAKQILAGKVDSKNETYISGNVGIKYRF
ncbi:autotransporter outer membrane beta-barrel domain-containing protein [Helicobacter pullorum]|uniref:Toxin outer membrane protein n=1 Tax=Helicobacter pullorum TaxID=35818 RepID=A0A377Q428_9HELI|nr:autotransporter outer membrane beta-barrel domain-containing protein [Helicobacter pullorum]STQ88583.1 toxin outer membrane protein [Helicobacter pullorum]